MYRFKQYFALLSKTDKAFVIAFLLEIAYRVVAAASGIRLPGWTLVGFIFFITTIVFLIRSVPRLLRSLLWRVRHRLLVTWVLVGVVPIVLICILVVQGSFILMGQVVSYMTTAEITRRSQLVRNTADALAWSLSHRDSSTPLAAVAGPFVKETSTTRQAQLGAIVKAKGNTFSIPGDGPIPGVPEWSKPGFVGLIKDKERHYFAAHVDVGAPADNTQLFLYEYAPPEFFKSLLPGVATVWMNRATASAGGIDIGTAEKPRSGVTFGTGRREDPDIQPLLAPPGRGWWDVQVSWLVLSPAMDLGTGKSDRSVAIVASRPSLILRQLFSTLGNFAGVAFILMAVVAAVLLVVEIVSILFGATLTRSITRAVADLYEGTRKVQAGDFSHRIPVRKNKDQLSELALSFNKMTERVQDLIIEVKEKERLENELEIAREVQSQLFPKEMPHLKTLQLWGLCQPARTVSGDYYDFLALNSHDAVLAIGDISGKGISAALLMAHIQSALRSQLMHKNGASSPSVILSILNDHLYTSSPPEKYATFFLGVYRDDDGQLVYTNAGHLAPMLVRDGKVTRLPGEGFPVGLFPGVRYDQQIIKLEPGDLLVGFTDGIIETPNREGEEFGDQRLIDFLSHHYKEPIDQIAGKISSAVVEWTGDQERHDDTTLVLARRI